MQNIVNDIIQQVLNGAKKFCPLISLGENDDKKRNSGCDPWTDDHFLSGCRRRTFICIREIYYVSDGARGKTGRNTCNPYQ